MILLLLLMSEQVLDTNPVHVKALYRRGMSYMLGGDFDDARSDFEKVSDTILEYHVLLVELYCKIYVIAYDQMITVDKSSEPDATAALLKLKQREQVRNGT